MLDKLISVARERDWRETERLLYEHWSQQCPLIFAPNAIAPWDVKVDEAKINDVLLHPVATAYCLDESAGADLKPLVVSCGLKEDGSRAGNICGRVFKCGEATYSCKECASDPTCVLCYQCFQRSVHKFHKYRMAASGGSGYCDCGDVEAWKQHPACEIHTSQTQPDDQQKSNEIPEDVSERVRALTRTILRYSTKLVCWPHGNDLPEIVSRVDLDPSLPPYQTILYNDETHTYDSVIRALNLSIHCNEQQAMLLATIVDREGRSSVRAGSNEFCARAKEEIQRRTQKDTNRRTEKSGPLEVLVVDTRLVAMQNFAIRLMNWLTAQTRNFPPLAWTVGEVLLNDRLVEEVNSMEVDDDDLKDTLLVHLMKLDRALWKAARANFHQMLMATVLMNGEHKQQFSRQFIRIYKKVFFDFIDDDHEHAVSITALTVQIFTVPTIARMLVADESALEHIFETLIDHCQRYLKEPDRKRFDFSAKSFPNVLRRALYMMYDQKYLLTVIPAESEWTQALRENFLRGCYSFVKFLSYMQGMDEVKRQSVEHQVWELEWETAFNIQLRVQTVTTLLIAWACSDKYVHAHLLDYLINEIQMVIKGSEDFSSKVKIKVNGVSAMCIPFDVTKCKLSIHQPLWRLLAGLFAAPASFLERITTTSMRDSTTADMLNLKGKRAMLYEMPMRVLVLCAQSQAQMWRRNGFSLINQVHNYLSPLCRTEMFDRDVLMMQVGAALSPPDVFLIRLLNRFALHNWAEVGFEEHRSSSPTGGTHEELSKSTVTLAEEMLHLLISIIGERFMPGVGVCTRKAMLRREVLHILATGPKPFSKIDRAIPECPLLEKLSLDEAVKSVADFRKPTKTSAGMFSLKKSVLNEYNAYFYHYSKTDISQAEQYQQKERANGDKSLIACPPPRLPSFEPFFRPITSLLRSSVLLTLIRTIIERTAKRSRYSSDALFHRALFLVGMGLVEEAANNKFDFIHAADESAIFELLEKLNGKPEVQANADLLAWTVQRYKELKAAASGLSTASSKKDDDSKDADRQAKRAAIAARMRKQAMEQMNRMQKKFITQNKDLLEAQKHDEEENVMSRAVDEDEEPIGVLPDDSGFPVCLGGARYAVGSVASRRVTCILCQEVEEVKFTGRALVCVAYQQQSCLFAQRHSKVRAPTDLLVSASLPVGMDASTCGHAMHFDCYIQYCDLLKSRERGRPRQQLALNQRMVDVEANEYLCPLCKRLSNTAMPLLPTISSLNVKRFSESRTHLIDFDEWVNTLSELINEPFTSQTTKPVRSHNRKRSHSERSLLEITKRGSEGTSDNILSTSVPSASALSLMMESEGTGEPVRGGEATAEPDEQQGGVVPHAGVVIGSVAERPAVDARILSMLPPLPSLPNVVHKIKEFMGHSKPLNDNVPTTLMTWEMIKCFLKAAHMRSDTLEDPCTNFGKNVMETVTAWQMTAFALRSIAAVLRCEKKPLFGAFNTRQRECFYNMSRVCAVAAFNCRPEDLRLVLGHLLAPLLGACNVPENSRASSAAAGMQATSTTKSSLPTLLLVAGPPLARSSPIASPTTTNPTSPFSDGALLKFPSLSPFANAASYASAVAAMQAPVNVLSVDMVSLAIELAMCIGWTWVDGRMTIHNGNKNVDIHVIPDGSQDELFAIRLALIGHLYQIFVSFDDSIEMHSSSSPRSPHMAESVDSDLESIISQLYTTVKPTQPLVSVSNLKELLSTGVVEFLRPLALFFHAVTLVPPPEALKDPSVHEYDSLCRYLGFSNHMADLLRGPCVQRLFTQWTAQQSVIPVPDIVRQPVMENRLVQLPEDFSELINQAASFKCPSIQMEEHASSVPTLCLICGTLLCSQSYCCQRTINRETLGACSYHLQNCSGPSGGMFLRIRDSQVILLASRARGCFHAAPYVDEFGETDFGFRRGNPLHLNHELYAKLEHLWLHQGICEEVVNQYEIDHRNIGFEWQHF
uniref:E3 ubiquitin-protein ligase n=1 Tax=Parascaris univalens TaxID=6257 RepID=A0A915CE69_PARUN